MRGAALIGMPGSGKTALGREAARMLGIGFADLDDIVEESQGRTIAEIFAAEGEGGFRRIETEALAAFAERDAAREEGAKGAGWAIYGKISHHETAPAPPTILSAGGGIVTRPENLPLLRRVGAVVYIERDIGEIASGVAYGAGRPLLPDKGALYGLWREREGLYKAWADAVFTADGMFSEAARRLSDMLTALLPL